MEPHFGIFHLENSTAEEPGRLHSMGSQRVGHDLAANQQHSQEKSAI